MKDEVCIGRGIIKRIKFSSISLGFPFLFHCCCIYFVGTLPVENFDGLLVLFKKEHLLWDWLDNLIFCKYNNLYFSYNIQCIHKLASHEGSEKKVMKIRLKWERRTRQLICLNCTSLILNSCYWAFWLFWKFISFLKFRKLINFDLNPNEVWYFDLSSFFSGHLEVTDLEAPGEDLIRICCSLQGAAGWLMCTVCYMLWVLSFSFPYPEHPLLEFWWMYAIKSFDWGLMVGWKFFQTHLLGVVMIFVFVRMPIVLLVLS